MAQVSVEALAHISVLSKVVSIRRKIPGCKPDRNLTPAQEVLTQCDEESQDKRRKEDWKEADDKAHHQAGENTAVSERKKMNISYKIKVLINKY